MNARVPVVAYVWRTWEHICDYVPLVAYVCMAYVPGMAYLGVIEPCFCCLCCCCCCCGCCCCCCCCCRCWRIVVLVVVVVVVFFTLLRTWFLVKALRDNDWCTEEGIPPSRRTQHDIKKKLMCVVGGAFVGMYLVLRHMMEHRTNERITNAVD